MKLMCFGLVVCVIGLAWGCTSKPSSTNSNRLKANVDPSAVVACSEALEQIRRGAKCEKGKAPLFRFMGGSDSTREDLLDRGFSPPICREHPRFPPPALAKLLSQYAYNPQLRYWSAFKHMKGGSELTSRPPIRVIPYAVSLFVSYTADPSRFFNASRMLGAGSVGRRVISKSKYIAMQCFSTSGLNPKGAFENMLSDGDMIIDAKGIEAVLGNAVTGSDREALGILKEARELLVLSKNSVILTDPSASCRCTDFNTRHREAEIVDNPCHGIFGNTE